MFEKENKDDRIKNVLKQNQQKINFTSINIYMQKRGTKEELAALTKRTRLIVEICIYVTEIVEIVGCIKVLFLFALKISTNSRFQNLENFFCV